jgi:LCP family protein required for cell wall assembly
MAKHGRRGRAADRSDRRTNREKSANAAALLALGAQVDTTAGAGATAGRGADAGDPSTPVANEAGLKALGEQMHGSKGRRSRGKRIQLGLVITLAVVLILVGSGAGYLYYLTHGLHREEVRGLSSSLTSGAEAGTENILMVGSTSRCALAHQNLAYGLCSQGVNGVNSDVIMILHADPAHHRLALLSIPRDLFIPNARSTGANKVDAGLFEGISQVVAAIEDDYGIPIQHAVSLNFDQFANVVDALGGINMAFPMSVFDDESGLNVQATSCAHLNGTQALAVVRARHLQYRTAGTVSNDAFYWPQETLSDLARIRRDHEFLRVLATAVAKRGLSNPVTDIDLINSVKADFTFDQSWSVDDMANLVLDFHSVSIDSVPQLTLPVAVVNDPDGAGGGLVYDGGSYGDVEFPAQAQDEAAVDQALGIKADTDSMTGLPLPAASAVTVSVLNGSGTTDQATDTSSALSALGFQMVGVGDTSPTGDVSETVVYYSSKSSTDIAAAEKVVRSLSGAAVMAFDPRQVVDGADVTVVTGSQFGVNAPAPTPAPASTATSGSSATTTTAPATTTTTTNAVSSSSSNIASPSPTTSNLQPWDPRACAAKAVPTTPVPNET